MTLASLCFMFLHSVFQGLHRHGHATETASLLTDAPGCLPAVIVQSCAPSEDPSHCAGHAVGEMIAPKAVEIRWVMSLRSLGYFLAWLDRSFWVNPRFEGRRLELTCSISGSPSRCHGPVESEWSASRRS